MDGPLVFVDVDASFAQPRSRSPVWVPVKRDCPRCGGSFLARRHNQKYCATTCKAPIAERACQHCGQGFAPSSSRALYCKRLCAERARLDRHTASVRARYGDDIPPATVRALAMKQREIDRGGYSSPGHDVSPARRREVVEAAGGRCAVCGGPGREVHHLGRGNAPHQLAYLCQGCHELETDETAAYFART